MSIKEISDFLLCGCLAMATLFTACNPTQDRGEIQNVPSTLTPTTIPSPGILAETLVADPEYLTECEAIGPSHQRGQLTYLGIVPGQSTEDTVRTQLGRPIRSSSFHGTEEWIYNGFNVYAESSIVTSIDVYEDTQTLISLKELIAEFGCPDLIFAVDTSIDQPSGSYGLTKFIYYSTGIEFFFLSFPISLSDIPTSIGFFKSESLESYLERYNYFNDTVKNSRPVSWNEAVK